MPRAPAAIEIRQIRAADDAAMGAVIRAVMTEMGASGAGFAIHDAEVDAMTASYAQPRAAYFVLDRAGTIVGGGGFAPLRGGAPDTCELRKMYFLPEARGLGLGRVLLRRCLAAARAAGFRTCYLETMQSMHAARALYAAEGFEPRGRPLGATGHFGCDAWYTLRLDGTAGTTPDPKRGGAD